MRRSLTWFLLLCAIGALVVLATRRPDGPGANFTEGDIAALIGKIGFLVLIGGAALTLFRERFAQAVQWTLLWVAIGLLLVVAYAFRFELRDVGDRVLAELSPGRPTTNGRAVADRAQPDRRVSRRDAGERRRRPDGARHRRERRRAHL